VSTIEREKGGLRRSDVVEMEDGGGRGGGRECGAGEWHEEERRWDTEESCKEHWLGSQYGHRGCGDKKRLRNEARRKRNAWWTVKRSRPS
jgi:hypothetical protein